MAKTKTKTKTKIKPKEILESSVYEDLSLEEKNMKNSGRNFKELIDQINSEFNISYWFMKPKWEEWALRLKLYNNQKRDKSAVGDPLMFTIHQTVLASLYDDTLSVHLTLEKLEIMTLLKT